MIITSNVQSKADWNLLRVKLKGLRYARSADMDNTKFSLDEPLDYFRTTNTGTVTAASLINIIGDEDFKRFITYVWEAKDSRLFPRDTVKMSSFIYHIRQMYLYGHNYDDAFCYWDNLYHKVAIAENNNLI